MRASILLKYPYSTHTRPAVSKALYATHRITYIRIKTTTRKDGKMMKTTNKTWKARNDDDDFVLKSIFCESDSSNNNKKKNNLMGSNDLLYI